ncbi:MliC family protein [Halothiobacillus sp. DCM-1]|uniref:MliC family protein n=1 Tax=Halothiobacillus sp. DCM-1 TaxID=3112558 RepID=UPI00324DCD82
MRRALALCSVLLVSGCATVPQSSTTTNDTQFSGTLVGQTALSVPPETAAVLDLRDANSPNSLITETRIPLKNQTFPLSFTLAVPAGQLKNGQPYLLQAALIAPAHSILWASDPVTVTADKPQVGSLTLKPFTAMGFHSVFRCGTQQVTVGATSQGVLMQVGDKHYHLRQAISASGARYVAEENGAVSFWSKGDHATVTLDQETLPECVPVQQAP